MFTARRHKLIPVLLILMLLFAAFGGPAAAAACMHSGPAATQASDEMRCAMGPAASCCCGPRTDGSAPAPGERLESERCTCSLQAPVSVPPAAQSKALRLVQQPDAILPASAGPAVALPAAHPWRFTALETGVPAVAGLRTGPSRAPPACL